MAERFFIHHCSGCDRSWKDRSDFLEDKDIILNGYQVNFLDLKLGWFLFTHKVQSCNSTLAVPAGYFLDLYSGPIFERRKTGTEECPEYCLHQDNLERCPSLCECAFVREIIQILRR
jgi:hypothetical protein